MVTFTEALPLKLLWHYCHFLTAEFSCFPPCDSLAVIEDEMARHSTNLPPQVSQDPTGGRRVCPSELKAFLSVHWVCFAETVKICELREAFDMTENLTAPFSIECIQQEYFLSREHNKISFFCWRKHLAYFKDVCTGEWEREIEGGGGSPIENYGSYRPQL